MALKRHVGMEAKRENSFLFCVECSSAIYSGESASLVLLDNIHHHWQTMPDNTFYLSGSFFCVSSAGRIVTILLGCTVFALATDSLLLLRTHSQYLTSIKSLLYSFLLILRKKIGTLSQFHTESYDVTSLV